jgi:hypothetical protein
MSTHEHLVLTDTEGQLPRFLQEFHRLVALGVKVLRGWEGAVWDHEKTSVVELRTPEAILEKIAYVMANPVAAGLVQRAHQWPGVTTRPEELGRASWTACRPAVYVDADNPGWPKTATLRLVMPSLQMRESAVRSVIADEVARLEQIARLDTKASGWRVIGRERIAKLSPYERAKSREPLRARNPVFAVGRGQSEAFKLAVVTLRAFRRAHRAALELWRAKLRDAVFPHGTWLMRHLHGVETQAP